MKFFVIGKRTAIIAIFVIVLILATLIIATCGEKAVNVSGKTKIIPIYRVRTDDKKVAISFDAAWGNEDTEELIKIMDQYGVKATFFIVGEWVDKYPESVKALHEAGHDIMNHSNSHPHMPKLTKEQMLDEINSCNEKIKNITGVTPNLFRMPYGDYDNESQIALSECGIYCIQWDVDSLDWKNLTAGEISQRVIKKVKPGSIVLFHNAALNTPDALPTIIERLQAEGYEFVKISDLIFKDNFAIDHTGEQYPKAPPADNSALSYITNKTY